MLYSILKQIYCLLPQNKRCKYKRQTSNLLIGRITNFYAYYNFCKKYKEMKLTIFQIQKLQIIEKLKKLRKSMHHFYTELSQYKHEME